MYQSLAVITEISDIGGRSGIGGRIQAIVLELICFSNNITYVYCK